MSSRTAISRNRAATEGDVTSQAAQPTSKVTASRSLRKRRGVNREAGSRTPKHPDHPVDPVGSGHGAVRLPVPVPAVYLVQDADRHHRRSAHHSSQGMDVGELRQRAGPERSAGFVHQQRADSHYQHAAVTGPGYPCRLRHHALQDSQRPRVHHGCTGDAHGPSGGHRHPAGVNDVLRRLADTPIALSIAHTTISLPLSIWLMSSFFEAVPRDLEEAATVDGCSRLGALWRVVIPVVSGGIAVTAIFAFLASWNEFLFALLMTAIRSQTTPVVIANFQTQFGLDWGGSMTALAAVYSIPVILLTLLLQRKIVAGMTLGAVKG